MEIVERAHAAVARSAAVRQAVARSRDDGRDERLRVALDDLSDAMAPIRARLLRAPSLGRRDFEPQLRAASAELQAERRRVNAMLHRRHGAPKKKPAVLPAWKELRSYAGTIRYVKGRANALSAVADDLAGGRRAMRGMPWHRWDREVVKPAREALQDARDARRLLYPATVRAERAVDGARTHLVAKFEALELDARTVRWELDRIERQAQAAIRAKHEPRKPGRRPVPAAPRLTRRKWMRWTAEGAQAALQDWERLHGRHPTRADLTDPDLPSYGTVHRLLGGLRGERTAPPKTRREAEVAGIF